ncbi:MAG: hypothetical protein LOD89_03925 [Tissierellales bacterium]
MRNFIEKLKDILYDGIDYILIIGIIAAIAFTINWKLNGIFAVADVDELYAQSSGSEESSDRNEKEEEIASKEDENEAVEEEDDKEKPTSNDEDIDKTEENSNNGKNVDKQEEKNDKSENSQTAKEDNSKGAGDSGKSGASGEIVVVSIPAGSLPGDIGNILTSKGLVESKDAFLKRVAETGTERKLRYGEFEISKNSTIDEIISILAR